MLKNTTMCLIIRWFTSQYIFFDIQTLNQRKLIIL